MKMHKLAHVLDSRRSPATTKYAIETGYSTPEKTNPSQVSVWNTEGMEVFQPLRNL